MGVEASGIAAAASRGALSLHHRNAKHVPSTFPFPFPLLGRFHRAPSPLPTHPIRAQMALLPKMASLLKGYATQAGAMATAFGAHTYYSHGGDSSPGRASGGDDHHQGGGAAAAGSLHLRGMLSCLRVLCAVASRAPWAAERVASEHGLVEAVREVRGASSRWWRADGRALFSCGYRRSGTYSIVRVRAGCPCVDV